MGSRQLSMSMKKVTLTAVLVLNKNHVCRFITVMEISSRFVVNHWSASFRGHFQTIF